MHKYGGYTKNEREARDSMDACPGRSQTRERSVQRQTVQAVWAMIFFLILSLLLRSRDLWYPSLLYQVMRTSFFFSTVESYFICTFLDFNLPFQCCVLYVFSLTPLISTFLILLTFFRSSRISLKNLNVPLLPTPLTFLFGSFENTFKT